MLVMPDIPPTMQQPVICAIAAAVEYRIPANIMLAVMQAEGGKPGQKVLNTNGTYDIGALQFNTAYLRTLAVYGITPEMAAMEGCYPYRLAAWRLHAELLTKRGDIWTRAALYHSATPYYNAQYRKILIRYGAQWARWLHEHFLTQEYGTTTINRPTGTVINIVASSTDEMKGK